MSSIIGRSALRATRPLFASGINPGAGADSSGDKQALKKGAQRDPELYILLAIMSGAFALAGWHFSRSPTKATSERFVAKAPDSEPWKSGTKGKYQYHPGGDYNAPKKDAPSALNEVVIPNVNLPKSLHDRFNKYGKEDW